MESTPLTYPLSTTSVTSRESDVQSYGPDFSPSAIVASSLHPVRLAFLSRVFSILALHLAFPAAACLLASTRLRPAAAAERAAHPWAHAAAAALAGCALLGLVFFKQRPPFNAQLLAVLSAATAYVAAGACATFSTPPFLPALLTLFFVAVAAVFAALALFCAAKRRSFNFRAAFFSSFVLTGAVHALFRALPGLRGVFGGAGGGGGAAWVHAAAAVAAVAFEGYCLADLRRLMGRLTAEDYVVAAASMYVDGVNLCVDVVRGASRDADEDEMLES